MNMDNLSISPNSGIEIQDPANNNTERRSATLVTATNSGKASLTGSTDTSKLQIKIVGPDEQEVAPDEIVVPPDGGYGYVIVFAAFMSNLIVDGIVFSFGSLKDSIYETSVKMGAPLDQASLMWVGSFLIGFSLISGPFASAAANKFGFRIVAMSGSLITAVACITSWYLNQDRPKIWILIVLYGIIGGIGFGCIHVPACVSVGFYFEKKRAIATGMALCGSGIGNCIFPPLITFLTTKLEWNGTVLVTGTIVLLCGFLGLLYKPLKPPKARKATLVVPIEDPECKQVLSEIKRNIMINNFATDIIKEEEDDNSRVKSDVLHFHHIAGKPSNPSVFTAGGPASSIASSSGWPWMMQKKMMSVPTILAGNAGEIPGFSKQPLLLESGEDSNASAKPTVSMKVKGLAGASPDLQEIQEERTSQEVSGETSKISVEKEPASQSRCNARKQQHNISNYGIFNTLNSSLLTTCTTARKVGSVSVACRVGNSMHFVDDRTNSRVIRLASKATLNKPLYRDDIFFEGSLFRIPDYANNPEMTSIEWSAAVTSPTVKEECLLAAEEKEEQLEDQELHLCDSSCELINKMLDFSLLRSPTFFMFATASAFSMLGLFVPFVFLVDYAFDALSQQNQNSSPVDRQTLTLLISLIGISNTVGRIISGWVADRPFVNALLVHNVSVTILGVSTLMVPLLRQYAYFMAFSCVFGLSMACFSSLKSILIVELLGLTKLTNAFGLLLLFQGITAMIATPLAGMIAQFGGDSDGKGDIALAFYAAGGFLLSSAFMCYPLRKINKWEKAVRRGASIN